MRFDRKKVFDGYRQEFGSLARLTQPRVDGLSSLLDFIEADKFLTRIEWPAYMLATTMIETAYTFKPIHEYGGHDYFVRRYGSQTAVGRRLGNDTPEEGADYSGEGDVQLTGEDNYERAEIALRKFYPEVVDAFEKRTGKKFDLTVGDQPNDKLDPRNAGDPAIAYYIMSFGMRTGMFTGKALPKSGSITANWRAIINGNDRAAEISAIGRKWQKILTNALISETEITPLSEVVVTELPELPTGGENGTEGVETAEQAMPDPAAPPKKTEQTTDVQVDKDGNTAVTVHTPTGFFKWLFGFVTLVLTGQATIPEFVTNGLTSKGFWNVVLNIFANLWTFKAYLFAGIMIWFIFRKLEGIILKIVAIRTNADQEKGNVVLTRTTGGWLDTVRGWISRK